MIKAPMSLQKRRRRIYRKVKSEASAGGGGVTRIFLPVKATDRRDRTHNPSDETCWVSRLRENLTSGSDGEGLETGRRRTLTGHEGGNPGYRQGQSCHALPRQSFTRQNKIAELVAFFNLNALSSPLMIRIQFDMLWTVIADTLYHRFAQNLPRFKHCRANTLFRKFVDMPGKITYDGTEFTVKIRKRACTPILMGINVLSKGVDIPWLEGKHLKFEWTA